MYKNLKLNDKIDLLMVCIETLHTYQYKPLYSGKYYKKLWEDLFDIKEHNHINYKTLHYSKNHKKTITIIQDIYKIINKLHLKKATINVINNCYNNRNSTLKQQYIRRYKYIYQTTKDYYKIKSQANKLNIEYQAIKNLYIINQVYNIKGIYILMKYLYS